jgi:ribonuclease P protein component
MSRVFGQKRQNEKLRLKKNVFPKRFRLGGNEEFKTVIAKRQRFSDNILALYVASNGREYSRLGVSVGKAVGNAVVRNRFKRLTREVFRLNREQIPAGFDYVAITSSKAAKGLTFEKVRDSFLKLAGKVV